jgi:D-alanine transaminase
MQNIGYYNGVSGPIEKMSIPMSDRAIYFGDGVYDFCICRGGIPYLLDEHIDRFFSSMSKIKIQPNFTKDELRAILLDLTSKVDSEISSLYWQVSRGAAKRAHIFPRGAEPRLYATVTASNLPDFSKEISCILRPDLRFHMCDVKTIDLLPSVLAAEEAEENSCAECILHRDGRVTECAHSNVSILKDGAFITAPTDNLILPGIARAHLIKACHALGVPVSERAYSTDELWNADEIIISSTTKFALRCTTLESKAVGSRDGNLFSALQKFVLNEFDEYYR